MEVSTTIMKYLVKGNRVLTTENWEEQNTIIKKQRNEKGELEEIKEIRTVEEFAKKHGWTVVDKKPEILTLKETKLSLENEKEQILSWLRENDWKVNKVVLSEWEATDPRWVEYKEQRAVKRARLDKIKEALGI